MRLIDYERKRQEQATKQRQDEIASFAMGLLQMAQDGDCPDGIFFGLYKDGACHHGLLGNLRDDLVIGRGAVSGLLRVINDILNERRRQG
ncbi:hypothetical protein ASL20_09825 [Cupriavidus necator]|nr:hypothetical protein ASL20_09825 [Cupriavidus necator]